MKKILLKLSIGFRFKIVVSISFCFIIISLGIFLFLHQKHLIFEQAKQNCYSTIDDLIRFTQNEIDASADRIEYFHNSGQMYLNTLGDLTERKNELIEYKTTLPNTQTDTIVRVPALYRGKTLLQSDTTIIHALRNIGINYFVYYQKVGDYYLEIINSENTSALKQHSSNITAINVGYSQWQLASSTDSIKQSAWVPGNPGRWVQGMRSFTKRNGEITGCIVFAIDERNNKKLNDYPQLTHLSNEFWYLYNTNTTSK